MEKLYKWPKLSNVGVIFIFIVFPFIPASLAIMWLIVGMAMIIYKIWLLIKNVKKCLRKIPLGDEG